MRHLFTALSAALLCLLSLPAHANLNVVTSVPDLAALAKAIGGDKADVTSLAVPSQDPHFVDARPNLALALNRADLLITVGLELEVGWLPTLQLGARNAKIQTGNPGYLDASQFVKLLEVPTAKVERSQGDVHPGGNPHYLYDPRAAVTVAQGIAARMAQLDSKNAATFQANLQKFTTDLEKARADWEKRLAGLRGAPVISYHRTTAYLSDWLGFTQLAFLEPKPGIPPNPSHVAKVLTEGRAQKARFLLQEDYYPDTTSQLVASKLPAPLVVIPGGTNFRGGETYLQHLEDVVKRLEQGLAGKGT
ncbi:metal ABC transporter substrate-binding protein [Stigmatella sp. ncwal1]|uniref:Metal ABC transporter substrate-binding protein n=1 Tax=Stigmatella ashevillensis TaxID=2995309 RepID=A0ABT5D494_9BACT|nr:metal ABC transporter substrate-binding protein [Stigmatella ashevillena]MDC0708494.1 metal ABC transporter substrate-binding protein [Stigmatella ashevillena]